MTVWIATTGDYSDYRVRGVFSSETNAKRFMELTIGDWNSLMEVEVDQFLAIMVGGYAVYEVHIDREGTIDKIQMDIPYQWKDKNGYRDNEDTQKILKRYYPIEDIQEGLRYHTPDGLKIWCIVTCVARNEQHAAKIAGDKRRIEIAEGRWPE